MTAVCAVLRDSVLGCLAVATAFASAAEAARPLATEDAGIVPAASGEAEFGSAVARGGEGAHVHAFTMGLKVGLTPRLDLGVEMPYERKPESGWREAGISLKFEALSAGASSRRPPVCICFSSGLGCQEYCLRFVTSREIGRLAFHANAGAATVEGGGRAVMAGAAEAALFDPVSLVGEVTSCGSDWETQVGARVATPWKLAADVGVSVGRAEGDWNRQVQIGGTMVL